MRHLTLSRERPGPLAVDSARLKGDAAHPLYFREGVWGMKIGFTGTQIGMTDKQKECFIQIIKELKPKTIKHDEQQLPDSLEFHHGDCIGADEDAHKLIQEHFPWVYIVIHPPTDDSKRAFCIGWHEMRAPLPYLKRDTAIVMETNRLIATPKTTGEKRRSGTWATIRYSRKKKQNRYIIYPNGNVSVGGNADAFLGV